MCLRPGNAIVARRAHDFHYRQTLELDCATAEFGLAPCVLRTNRQTVIHAFRLQSRSQDLSYLSSATKAAPSEPAPTDSIRCRLATSKRSALLQDETIRPVPPRRLRNLDFISAKDRSHLQSSPNFHWRENGQLTSRLHLTDIDRRSGMWNCGVQSPDR